MEAPMCLRFTFSCRFIILFLSIQTKLFHTI